MVRRATILTCTFAFAVMLASVRRVSARERPTARPADVIRLADAEASRRGYRPRAYARGTPRFFPKTELNAAEWIISYERKPGRRGGVFVGDHFFVHVDDTTKKRSVGFGR